MDDLRYPIGKYEHATPVALEEVAAWIDDIAALPAALKEAVAGLVPDQFEVPYRPGGWTLRQVVHHLGDSHLNSFVRFKWTLTEDNPVIKPYDQNGWAAQADYRLFPIDRSIEFLELLHARWVVLLRALTPDDLARTYRHPESGEKRLDWTIGMYAWHGRHHLAHITRTIEREGW